MIQLEQLTEIETSDRVPIVLLCPPLYVLPSLPTPPLQSLSPMLSAIAFMYQLDSLFLSTNSMQ